MTLQAVTFFALVCLARAGNARFLWFLGKRQNRADHALAALLLTLKPTSAFADSPWVVRHPIKLNGVTRSGFEFVKKLRPASVGQWAGQETRLGYSNFARKDILTMTAAAIAIPAHRQSWLSKVRKRLFTHEDAWRWHAISGFTFLVYTCWLTAKAISQGGILHASDAGVIEAFVYPCLMFGSMVLSALQFKVPKFKGDMSDDNVYSSDITSGSLRSALTFLRVAWGAWRLTPCYPAALLNFGCDAVFAVAYVLAGWRYPGASFPKGNRVVAWLINFWYHDMFLAMILVGDFELAKVQQPLWVDEMYTNHLGVLGSFISLNLYTLRKRRLISPERAENLSQIIMFFYGILPMIVFFFFLYPASITSDVLGIKTLASSPGALPNYILPWLAWGILRVPIRGLFNKMGLVVDMHK